MADRTFTTLKKSYLYSFFPTKEEEERQARALAAGIPSVTAFLYRLPCMLVEIRDIHAPPAIDPRDPWQIKKKLSRFEADSRRILVPFVEAFEYILRYWNFNMASYVTVLGRKVAVVVWDETNGKIPRRYEGSHVQLQMLLPAMNFQLVCEEVMRARNMKAEDEIGLYWDTTDHCFRFKLFPKTVS